MINKFFTIAAKISLASSMFFASGVGEALKEFFIWLFDKSCDPSKHNIPGWEDIAGSITNLFM